MIVAEGHRLMAATGFAGFSAREVARRVGYSIGTIYNVFDSLDHLLIAINSRTFELWTDYLQKRIDQGGEDRIRTLVEAYFDLFTRAASQSRKPHYLLHSRPGILDRAVVAKLREHGIAVIGGLREGLSAIDRLARFASRANS